MELISTILWIFVSLTVVLAVLASIVIFLENRDPSKTLVWILVLTFFPVFGFIFYLFFGQNIRKKKTFKTQKAFSEIKSKKLLESLKSLENLIDVQKRAVMDEILFNDPNMHSKRRIIGLLLNTGRSPFTLNNRIKILNNGTQKFDHLLKDIEDAKDHIHMQYYIIKDSHIGNEISDLLIKKAKQGVKIRFLYDDVGSWQLWFNRDFFRNMKEAGVEVQAFLPAKLPFLNRKVNYRNHRKIVVIDGVKAYIGGINIGDEYLGKSKEFGYWRDTHMKIEGEAVYMIQLTFLLDWYLMTKEKDTFKERYFPTMKYFGHDMVQIVSSGPDSDWESIHKAFFAAITQAKRRVYIQTPYFIPDDSLLMALKTAALSGVDVKIMFPSRPDHKTVYYASLSYLKEIIDAGGKVFLYEKGFIHSKMMLVDDDIATIGTANMDLRSFMINFEINGFLYDKHIIKRIQKDFNNDLRECTRLEPSDFEGMKLSDKIKQSFARLFSPIL